MNTEKNETILSVKEIFARNLQSQIDLNKTSVYQISKDTGISHSYLYDLCDPKNSKKPSMAMIERIANYFGIGANELLTKEKPEK